MIFTTNRELTLTSLHTMNVKILINSKLPRERHRRCAAAAAEQSESEVKSFD